MKKWVIGWIWGIRETLSVIITTVTSAMWQTWVHSQNEGYHPKGRISFNCELGPCPGYKSSLFERLNIVLLNAVLLQMLLLAYIKCVCVHVCAHHLKQDLQTINTGNVDSRNLDHISADLFTNMNYLHNSGSKIIYQEWLYVPYYQMPLLEYMLRYHVKVKLS